MVSTSMESTEVHLVVFFYYIATQKSPTVQALFFHPGFNRRPLLVKEIDFHPCVEKSIDELRKSFLQRFKTTFNLLFLRVYRLYF